MPTYQYRCADCGHQLEVVQSFTDEALTRCPECAGQLRKQFSAVGVVFKGSGFYRTDSGASGNGKRPSEGAKDGDSSKDKSTSTSTSSSSDSGKSSSSDSSGTSSKSTASTSSSSSSTATATKS